MTGTRVKLERILGSSATIWSLFILNVFVTLAIVWISRDTQLGDSPSYVALANGILNGEYTQWWRLDQDIPDTWRTPGFPLYVAVILWLFGGEQAVLVFQFLLYVAAMFLTLRFMDRYDVRPAVKSLFLILLLPLVNVPFYIGHIYPEIPVLASITAALYMTTRPGGLGWGRAIALGLLYGFIFQCRPVFMLFPPLMAVLIYIDQRGRYKVAEQMVVLVVFGLTLLPYGFWNLKHHDVFKITPLEGGGGMVHFGYWAGKIPAYTESVYWRNFTGDEVVMFVEKDSIPAYIQRYEGEWAEIKSQLEPFLTAQDTIMLNSRPLIHHPISNTFNTAYTLERERLLIDKTVENIQGDLGYYMTYKAYSAIRLWIIGIQRGDFLEASTMGRLKMLFPTVVTGILFLMAVILIPLAYVRKRLSFRATYPLLVYMFYFWAIHIPFVIQARYTTPVRFAMLMMIALAIAGLWWGRSTDGVAPAGASNPRPGSRS